MDAVQAMTDSATARVTLPGHTLAALSKASLAAKDAQSSRSTQQSMTLTVVLKRSDPEGFARFVDDLYTPGSSSYRTFTTPDMVSDRFGPSRDDFTAVQSFLVQ